MALSALIAATAGCALEPLPEPLDCSIEGKNERLFNLMKDIYLWYPEVPDVDYRAYPSPEALLEALVYKDLDRWSYILSRDVSDAYFEEGRMRGLGFQWKYDHDDNVRYSFIHPGSPAFEAGLKRGDKVLEVGGKTIVQIDKDELWEDVIGEDREGVEVAFKVERATGDIEEIRLTKQWFSTTTTPIVKILSAGPDAVGYLLFTSFVETSAEELVRVFEMFKRNNVKDLILDLRYNGGGRLDIATLLASLVRGSSAYGDVFETLLHNDRYTDWNTSEYFWSLESSLDLKRVFVIVTQQSASASEAFINGLRPHMDVLLIGGTTHGKPVGMYGWNHCDIVMKPIAFSGVNADGEGDYYDGFEPRCFADDLLTAELGSGAESSLAEALYLLQNGSCSTPPPSDGSAKMPRAPIKEIPLRGFRRETGSF